MSAILGKVKQCSKDNFFLIMIEYERGILKWSEVDHFVKHGCIIITCAWEQFVKHLSANAERQQMTALCFYVKCILHSVPKMLYITRCCPCSTMTDPVQLKQK